MNGRSSRRKTGRKTYRAGSEHFVFHEPGLHVGPGGFGRFGPVAGTVIGVEAVRRAGEDLELSGLASGSEGRLHRLDLGDGDALVGLAVKAEHRRLHFGSELGRAL